MFAALGASLLKPVGTAIAKSGISAPSWMQNFDSTVDPVGRYITSKGGDPLNIYGNKNNPNAWLFQGNAPGGAAGGASGGAAGGAFGPMGSGIPQGQIPGLTGAFNNYLSAIGRPQMSPGSLSGSPLAPQTTGGISPQVMAQLQAMMQGNRSGQMPFSPSRFSPMTQPR